MIKTRRHQVQPEDEGRIDTLVARLLGFSRARVRGLIEHAGVSISGSVCAEPGAVVRAGQQVELRYDPERRYREKPVARPTRGFSLVYADEYLAVVIKDAGLLTVPTEREEGNTLIDRLSTHLGRGTDRCRVAVVHRLDRETSGLLVFGRTPVIAQALSDQFAERKPMREYAAIVAGRVAPAEGELRSHLATDKALNQRSIGKGGKERGELAVTHYQVRAQFPDATLVAVRLETGRRNQIRVHFSELGHPVLGDQRYQPAAAAHPRWRHERLALHARLLGFQHPVGGQPMRFVADLPPEFLAFGVEAGAYEA